MELTWNLMYRVDQADAAGNRVVGMIGQDRGGKWGGGGAVMRGGTPAVSVKVEGAASAAAAQQAFAAQVEDALEG